MYDHSTRETAMISGLRGSASRRARAGQRGSTLVELLVAAAVMGLVVLGIASGYLTTAKIAGRNDDVAASEAALTAAVEVVGDLPYVPCSQLDRFRADVAALDPPEGYTVTVASVRYLSASGTSFVAGPCTTDRGAQLVALDVTRDRPGASPVRGEVVLRNPGARP